jgi:enolase-phosphatase E1
MIKAVLLDIEGTTTPIDFVHKTLFPYSKQRIRAFVETHFSEIQTEVDQLAAESARDESYTRPVDSSDPNSVSDYLEHLIDSDRKSTPLKSIQGMIWKHGYESGDLRSIMFDDVPAAFERWMNKGIRIAIFSSGSVLAQQLLFRYTDHGDLTSFISNYFDTNVGPKREATSYEAIADELSKQTNEVIFLSDIVEELDAARTAGMQTALTVRPGNAEVPRAQDHKIVSSFDERLFER